MHGTMHNKHCPSASNSVPRVYIYCLYLLLAAYSPACVDTSPRTRKRASLKKEREREKETVTRETCALNYPAA